MKLLWALVVVGCGDNAVPEQPIDSPPLVDPPVVDAMPDAATALPDLHLMAAEMDGSILIMNSSFNSSSCEIIEQCIGDIGTRRLLRFDTVTANLGTADLKIGMPPAPGVSEPPFIWSACHGHHHFDNYATYELLNGTDVVVAGHKQAFCVLDTLRVQTGAPTQGYDCTNQGLSVGWADVYARGLPCQWIDVTGVPAGTYTLRVRINPVGAIQESDTTNNEWTKTVTL